MLRSSLAALPPTLDETYDRILTDIKEKDSIYALRILQWLAFSVRPLHIEEVAEVVAIDVTREPVFNHDEVLVDPQEALEICSGLVTVASNTWNGQLWLSLDTITLAHYSVKEYLVSDRIKQGPAKWYSMQEVECHKALTRGTLGYLSQLQQPISRQALKMSVLTRYSATHWYSHFQTIVDETEEVSRLAVNVLSRGSPAYLTWLRLADPENDYPKPNFTRTLESTAAPIYYGALLGVQITRLLLEQNPDVNITGGVYGNALQAAATNGHKAVVKLLIDAGADVNASGGHFGNALQAASARGHMEIAEMLLNANAAVNMQGGYHNNALQAAIQQVDEPMVKLLLERGADTGLKKRSKGALHHAINDARCTPSLAKALQQFGAPLNTSDVDNMTPLHYCVKFGHTAIAKQLLDAGVPINPELRTQAPPGRFGAADKRRVSSILSISGSACTALPPLHLAALIGNATMIEFLLKHGADPNAVSRYGETALHLALRTTPLGIPPVDDRHTFHVPVSYDKHKKVLDMLLAVPTLSVTSSDCKGDSPLHCIGYGEPNSTELLRALVLRGADPSKVNLSQQTPMHLASEAGNFTAVTYLLSLGTKVALADSNGRNSLHCAVQSGNIELIIAILQTREAGNGNLIASKDKDGRNVLHQALSNHYRSRVQTVELLLDHGADALDLDDTRKSPLAICLSLPRFDMAIFRSLLKIEEIASYVTYRGQTVGHLCVRALEPDIEMMRLLNDSGVDLAKKDCDGRTILHCAAMFGSLTDQSLQYLVNIVGLQVDEEDEYGRTALQYAIEAATEAVTTRQWDRDKYQRTRDILVRDQAAPIV